MQERSSETPPKTRNAETISLKLHDIEVCLEKSRKMEISALEESKGLSQECPAKAHVGLPCKSNPQTKDTTGLV